MNYTFECDDYKSFLDYALAPKEVQARASRSYYNGKWAGTRTWEDAVDLAILGCRDVEGIKGIGESLSTSLGEKMLSYSPKYDVSGAYVDIGRYIDGDPECMVDFDPCEAKGNKVVKIVVNASVSAQISPESIRMRGAAILSFCDLLAKGKIESEIYIVEYVSARGDDTRYKLSFPLKKAGEHIDLDRLAFVLGHPSFQRRIMFSAQEMAPVKVRQHFGFMTNSGYGRPEDLPESERGDVYLGRLIPEHEHVFQTEAAARLWITSNLEAQGIVIEK